MELIRREEDVTCLCNVESSVLHADLINPDVVESVSPPPPPPPHKGWFQYHHNENDEFCQPPRCA